MAQVSRVDSLLEKFRNETDPIKIKEAFYEIERISKEINLTLGIAVKLLNCKSLLEQKLISSTL